MESDSEDSDTNQLVCTRRQIFDILQNKLHLTLDDQLNCLEKDLAASKECFFTFSNIERMKLKKLLCTMKKKWDKASRNSDFFFKSNKDWLESSTIMTNTTRKIMETSTPNPKGRPCGTLLNFDSASQRTKRRRTEDLRRNYGAQELAYATQMSLRSSGSTDAAKVVHEVTTTSPCRASKYREAYTSATNASHSEMSGDEALVDFVNIKMTKQQYKDLRKSLKSKNIRAYPSYESVVEAKKRCYPDKIAVSDVSAEVPLQNLLDHTCKRILFTQNEVLNAIDLSCISNIKMICKWGCDGSSGQSEYKQAFENEMSSDAQIFFTSLVPLQIVALNDDSQKEIILWKNPKPSSPRYCRPIRLQFLKETIESTLDEKQYISNQINDLQPFQSDIYNVTVTYSLHFTMMDQKVCNAVAETSSTLRCYLCKSTSKEFNNVELMASKKIDMNQLELGLSSLHAWIRFFECFLHVGYKIGIKKWQARSDVEKTAVKERKQTIQAEFKKVLHLNVDRPKVGFGSSNDGNTARRFFENVEQSSVILGVDKALIEKCHVILQAISSGFAINVEAFRMYCLETANRFVELYPWYCMPTAVHKILIHGHEIIDYSPLPIGQMSEEAQEARNKDIKKYRENYSRKCSRTATMQDVFQRLLLTSDPYISSQGKNYPKPSKKLSPEAIQLLLSSKSFANDTNDENDVRDSSSSEDSDDEKE